MRPLQAKIPAAGRDDEFAILRWEDDGGRPAGREPDYEPHQTAGPSSGRDRDAHPGGVVRLPTPTGPASVTPSPALAPVDGNGEGSARQRRSLSARADG